MKNRLNNCPEGKLICAGNGQYCKWYQSNGKDKIYIPKKNKQLAEQLALKKYLSLQLMDSQNQKSALEKYLHIESSGNSAEQFIVENPEFHRLLAPYFRPLSEELTSWAQASYECNTTYPEHLTIKTCCNHYVRSKSEALIETFLYTQKIPFRYECALQLNGLTIFPDFTIRHPATGNFYYWEHFGQIDIPNYNKHIGSRLQTYISNGIYPSIQLITTFETKQCPLSSETIERIIQQYFL